MKSIVVSFKNCYGIRALDHQFDTACGETFLVYAPNGVMKTCFARVFDDVARGESPRDVIFPHRPTSHSIQDETGADIPGDQILVVEPFDENYRSKKTATLMLSEDLRVQYEALVEEVQSRAESASAAIGTSAGIPPRRSEAELLEAHPAAERDLLVCLQSLQVRTESTDNPGLSHVRYTDVFNDKVLTFLSKPSTCRLLGEYVDTYDELLENSTYFRRGVFNHTNATSVHKVLLDNGFFAAHHSVLLADRDARKVEIDTPEGLREAIEDEKKQILSDPELSKRFEAIDKEISRNAELRRFRDFLEGHRELVPRLADVEALRADLWLSYAFENASVLSEFKSTYQRAKVRIETLIETAKEQETEWRRIVALFHNRFTVPFRLEVANQDDVILKDEAPTLRFHYSDGTETREIEKRELLSVLSTGEQRALYVLNVLFEIEARRNQGQKTVLILDDIADSFDYKNKYAIVEYLKDIQEYDAFLMLILTHNFDFFRTVTSRLGVGRAQNCLMATKSGETVTLAQAEHLNPFVNWRKNLHKNRKMMLAVIPMVRNLIEYTRGQDDSDYVFLTTLLHVKPKTRTVTMAQLAKVLNGFMDTTATCGDDLVVDAIHAEAKSCTTCEHSIQLENKVVISIGIRLLAEELMIAAIDDAALTDDIDKNQTRALYDIYCSTCNGDDDGLRRLLERVMLMTPDTIHLNSFMYEPILDMSDNSLRDLYDQLKGVRA